MSLWRHMAFYSGHLHYMKRFFIDFFLILLTIYLDKKMAPYGAYYVIFRLLRDILWLTLFSPFLQMISISTLGMSTQAHSIIIEMTKHMAIKKLLKTQKSRNFFNIKLFSYFKSI